MKITEEMKRAVLKEQASNGGKRTVELYGKKHMSNIKKQYWIKKKALDKNKRVV